MRSSAFERRMLFQRGGSPLTVSNAIVSSFDRASIVPQQS
jgi:hypothetical protein